MATHRTLIEPFRIKMVEPLAIRTPEEREAILKRAGYNLFFVPAEDVTFDLLTDSGLTAMSAAQWSAMMNADESYAGSKSFQRFEEAVKRLTGMNHVIPTHQGRAAEHVLCSLLVKPGVQIPSNNHFNSTRANIEAMGGVAVDIGCVDGAFKGNIDLARLEGFCKEHQGKIPFGMLTITNNNGGGQPVSLENIRAAAAVYKKYAIPFILDACRFAENSYFIKTREKGMSDVSVREIARKTFDCADGFMLSAKKDALVNMGGMIALRSDEWIVGVRDRVILFEGFPTYGGLAARDIEAMTVGFEEGMDEDYLRHRIETTARIAERMNKMGIPVILPPAAHAIFIDATAFLPHVKDMPAQALTVQLYRNEGVRTITVGANLELVRVAIPRRVYTQSHYDYILEGMQELVSRKAEIRGVKMISGTNPMNARYAVT